MSGIVSLLDTPIEYLKGVGPVRGETLRKELNVHRFRDLLTLYPFRYIDKTKFHSISEIKKDGELVQLKGTLVSINKVKGKNRFRLVGLLKDHSGFLELIWFQHTNYIEKSLQEGKEYIVYGRITNYKGKKNIAHPEMELFQNNPVGPAKTFDPVYSSSEKLDSKGLDSKGRRKIIKELLSKISERDIQENIPEYIISKLKLCSRYDAIKWIHFPANESQKTLAINRIKFEEFFYLQIRILYGKELRKRKIKGAVFAHIGPKFNQFYNEKLSFELTGAQKKVIKEIRADLGSGVQMNRLLQGDVGSGKTVVALMITLIAIDNDYQGCLVAPTEILAQQHYISITEQLKGLGLRVGFLTGSVKGKKRSQTLQMLKDGDLHIIIGTHALFEDNVIFNNLGLAIIDEQHKFGVAQRAKLWSKNRSVAPHILVMTATPIPRTMAMTIYGDLDVSVIDELPPGRKEVKTLHKREVYRPSVIRFMRQQIEQGRQIYVVYPLIEESEKLDLQNLQTGYEIILRHFPIPKYQISVVHGRMKPQDKELEMQRFVENVSQIMVATTVIEVGVNVPNATVMIIENTERFGLSQLHQLRGRVGRGGDQSYCILMSGYKMSKEAKERINTMVRTNNGFEIAEADLKLRGPGDIEGTQQSGIAELKLINLVQDTAIMRTARHYAEEVITKDAFLSHDDHKCIGQFLAKSGNKYKNWGRIS